MFLLILLLIIAVAIIGSWISVSAVTAAAGTVAEPAVTWNLYVAPVITFLTGALILLYINRKFSASDRKDERIAELITEKEQKKDADLDTWRTLYVKKQDDMMNILKDVCASLKLKMDEKDHDEHCATAMGAMKDELHNHCHTEKGDFVIRRGRA